MPIGPEPPELIAARRELENLELLAVANPALKKKLADQRHLVLELEAAWRTPYGWVNEIPPVQFDLQIDPLENGCRVRVLSSPFGQAECTCPILPAFPSLPKPANLRRFGIDLFNAIFQNEVLALLRSAQYDTAENGAILQLLLRMEGNLHNIPWEFLCDPASNVPLAVQPNNAIIRYLAVAKPHRPIATSRPLRLLVITANPKGYQALDAEREWKILQEILYPLQQRGILEIERLEKPMPLALQRRLRQSDVHLLHFIGHGGFDDAAGEGILLFEDEQQNPLPVGSNQLVTLLSAEQQCLGLVVLNACQTAQASPTDPFTGLAQSIIRIGIPAVIANRQPILDHDARILSDELYCALAEGFPVDYALAEGRRALFNSGSQVSWGIPALYLRTTDTHLFPKVKPA